MIDSPFRIFQHVTRVQITNSSNSEVHSTTGSWYGSVIGEYTGVLCTTSTHTIQKINDIGPTKYVCTKCTTYEDPQLFPLHLGARGQKPTRGTGLTQIG